MARDTLKIPSLVCPYAGASQSCNVLQTEPAQICSNPGNYVCQLSHSADFGDHKLTAALQAQFQKHSSLVVPPARRSSQGTLELPAELPGLHWDLVHSEVSSADQIVGKEEMAFQTCFSFLQISNFSCPHRKGQYKEKKSKNFFYYRDISDIWNYKFYSS